MSYNDFYSAVLLIGQLKLIVTFMIAYCCKS